MCGIAGVLSPDGGAAAVTDRVGAMERALAHRGPDGHGVWLSASGDAAFAHTRLAIIDPTPAGDQPMTVDDGRLAITFNGEIYNFLELRAELESSGVRFRSTSDTEVVLRAYEAFGERCVERLRGMFAFAIWDAKARLCLLARDRVGIKPLYYASGPERLVFASELKAIVASGLIPLDIDPSAVYEYFRTGSVPEPGTLLRHVRCLEPGHVATWRPGRLDQRRYYDLSFEPAITSDEAITRTREVLVDSVEHHFVSDVPVGVFLSGGVDSTALLAIASQTHQDTRALTMALPGTAEDELALARRTAEHFGVRHDVCDVDGVSSRNLFADYLRAMDQPSIDGMNTLAVSKLAQSCGLKVMLSGIGADELFGGYPSIRAVPQFTKWHRRLSAAGPLRTTAGRLLERLPAPRLRRIGDMLGQDPQLSTSYATYRGIFTRAEAQQLTRQFVNADPQREVVPTMVDADPTPQDAACRLEMTRYLRNQLLRDSDAMSMACGVEVRVPYLDARVIETVTAIPQAVRLAAAKGLLRAAVPEIPEWIASQPKRGFMFPMEEWLRGPWRGVFDNVAARSSVPARTWYRQWCMHALEQWLDRLRDVPPAGQPQIPLAAHRRLDG